MSFKRMLSKQSPALLTGIAVVGLVYSVVSAVKATPKALDLIQDEERAKERPLTVVETIKTAGPVYIPTIAAVTATIICMSGVNVLNRRHQAMLTSGYAVVTHNFQEYRNKVVELLGEEVDEDIANAVMERNGQYHAYHLDTPDKKVRFYEPYSKTYITRYEREIMDAEYHLNRNYVLRGYTCLNEFLDFLDIPNTDLGEKLGWTTAWGDGYFWVDFSHILKRDKYGDYYEIDYGFGPDYDYMEDWE